MIKVIGTYTSIKGTIETEVFFVEEMTEFEIYDVFGETFETIEIEF